MRHSRFLSLGLLFVLYASSHRFGGHRPPLQGLSFEENRGQAGPDARYLAHGHGYNLVLTSDGNHLLLRNGRRRVSVATSLVNSNAGTAIYGEDKQLGKVHYLRGRTSLTDIPTYARVRYESVYSGIDLIYYGNEQQLEYDFVVKPHADPNRIALRFDNVDALTLDSDGNLVVKKDDSEIVQHRPIVYQNDQGMRRHVDGSYRLIAANTVGFDVGAYDRDAMLVIDPILSYSTFLGGSNGDDDARAVATDSAGNVYITGSTTSTNFQTANAFEPSAANQDPAAGVSDAFITKLNPAGTSLIYSTYYGGSSDDDSNAIAVDPNGNVVVVGSTTSADLPTTPGALRRTCNVGPTGCSDAFVAEVSASGSGLLFATYLGGSGDDEARSVAVDSFGNSYILGSTNSSDFPTTPGAYSTDPQSGSFVTKLTAAGTIVYSTYFGTIFGPADAKALAIDSAGNAYITGSLTIPGSNTGLDVFISKLNIPGSAILYTQTLRAAKDEVGRAITVDAAGNAYITGDTSSINFPTTQNSPQAAYGGGPAFRSTDSGSTWSISRSGFSRSSLFALAVMPGNPSTVYAGADDEGSGGVFKSTNSGDSWTNASNGILDARVHALAVDPSSPTTVYAGTRTLGVYKSTNGATTWSATTLNNEFVTALAIDPGTPSTIYAGTDADGIFKSITGGASWFPINSGLGAAPVRSIVVDPNSSSTVYAATSVGVYKSTNGGNSWTSASSGLLDPNINAIVADPRTPNVLFVGTNSIGVFRSVNGGTFWIPSNGGLTSSSSGIAVSALTLDASSGIWYAAIGQGNAMQVYKSSNGTSWTPTSLSTTRVSMLAAASNSVYAATVGGTDAFVVKWNPSGSIVYATYFGGSRDDTGTAIAVDSAGGIYIAGSTSSPNLPTSNPLQASFGGGSGTVSDAFAAKLNPSGDVSFSTFLGGSSDDFGKGIAVDSSNTAYVVGVTASSDFPTTAAITSVRPGLLDAFVVKIGEGTAISYAVPIRGGFSGTSQGLGAATSVGYGRIQQTTGGNLPSGLAIFGFRQNNVLVSEAAVPASTPIRAGRIYAEVGNNVNTGLAIANPNSTATSIDYFFTDATGRNFGGNTIVLAPNQQLANFLNQSPFSGGDSVFGTFTFTATQPVAVIALRGFTNQRGEFLITTLPVADLSVAADTDNILFPQFADGNGWTTQILFVNTTDAPMNGSVQFTGLPSQDYSIAARSAAKVTTSGAGSSTVIGSVRVVPAAGTNAPVGVAVFSFKSAGITVTEAGVPSMKPGTAFRIYAEVSGSSGQIGSIETGIAIANPSSTAIPVTFEVTTIGGFSTGLSTTMVLQGNGQSATFLSQLFPSLGAPFQGVLRVSTTSPSGITVVGLRGRYNERRDFLITTTPPTNEAIGNLGQEEFFPHFADGGGYSTQFILFNGVGDQPSAGLIRFYGQSGQPLSVSVR